MKLRGTTRWFIGAGCALLTAACCHFHRPAGGVRLVAGNPSGSLESSSTLVAAFPIVNAGGAAAENVAVTAVVLEGAERISAPAQPAALGGIQPGGRGTAFASFSGSFTGGGAYRLKVEGTYTVGHRKESFAVAAKVQLPPQSPGSAVAKSASSPPHKVTGAPYPHRAPNFSLNEVNRPPRWTVPTGTFRQPPPRSQATAPQPAPQGDPPGIDFVTNAALGLNGSTVNEPSGASGGGVVFMTANWFAAFSTTGGASFTQLDPTTIFPNGDGGGFCCDQVVQYVPSIDRIIWLMQYGSLMRIAAASPADIASSGGTAWTYWDITAAQLGYGSGMDFPDLAIGDNSLYGAWDDGGGLLVVRIPLQQIHDSATIFFNFTNPADSSMAVFGRLTQNTRDEVFWAGHNSNSSLRVFSWQESSGTYFWRDVGVGSWPNDNTNLKSLTPDGQDWLSKLRDDNNNFIQGATRLVQRDSNIGNQIWFAWTAPSGENFPQSHVQIVVLDRGNDFRLLSQLQIWNPSYAFAYPSLTLNSDNAVGMSLEYGGGGNFENHVAGFWGDFIVYITTASNAGVGRFGDYVTIRPNPSQPGRFDAFGYGVQTGSTTDTRYIVFGRP
jgi:hypothetical protein